MDPIIQNTTLVKSVKIEIYIREKEIKHFYFRPKNVRIIFLEVLN